jgi:dienelactone hydrolase
MMKIISDVIQGENHAPIAVDFHFPSKGDNPVPVIIFLHGFKGFKDWGHFPLVADYLTRSGFAAVRFNFSLNGTTPKNQTEFVDLDAFGRNTYSQELADVSTVIDTIFWRAGKEMNCDPRRLGIIGHSRGGGIAILAARADVRVKAVATWAGVCEFESRVNPPDLEEWKKKGVVFTHNGRTGQDMPLNISLREDFYANKKKLDIPFAVNHMNIPQLIVHGTSDESVSISEALKMKEWNLLAQYVEIENANHTFGGKHPWESKELPVDTIKALQPTIAFFRETL